jgi:hypothetical protein
MQRHVEENVLQRGGESATGGVYVGDASLQVVRRCLVQDAGERCHVRRRVQGALLEGQGGPDWHGRLFPADPREPVVLGGNDVGEAAEGAGLGAR